MPPLTPRERQAQRRNRIATVAASIFAVVALVLLGVYIVADGPGAENQASRPAPYTPPESFPGAAPQLGPLSAPPGTKVVVVGDSWSMGYSAKPDTDGFVWQTGRAFGWDIDMRAVSGTGYVDAGDWVPVTEFRWVTGQYGSSVRVWNAHTRRVTFWNPSRARKAATAQRNDERKGVRWGRVIARVEARTYSAGMFVRLHLQPVTDDSDSIVRVVSTAHYEDN